jgi:DNA polymerase III delta prime subunit
LKTLEEPAPKTLFLLLTDQPDAILPTIVSRAQRIDLPLSSGELEGDDYDEIAEAFAARNATALAEKPTTLTPIMTAAW